MSSQALQVEALLVSFAAVCICVHGSYEHICVIGCLSIIKLQHIDSSGSQAYNSVFDGGSIIIIPFFNLSWMQEQIGVLNLNLTDLNTCFFMSSLLKVAIKTYYIVRLVRHLRLDVRTKTSWAIFTEFLKRREFHGP